MNFFVKFNFFLQVTPVIAQAAVLPLLGVQYAEHYNSHDALSRLQRFSCAG